MQIKTISAKDTHNLRRNVLYPEKSSEKVWEYQGDEDDQTFHLGAFIEGKLVSVASFFFRKNQAFNDENQYRMRGVATVEEFRGQGFSSSLIKTAIPFIKRNSANLVWCNARKESIKFYKVNGFEIQGDEFEIPGIGPHKTMFKYIP